MPGESTDSFEVVMLSARDRWLRWGQVAGFSLSWILIVVLSQLVSSDDDVMPLVLLVIAISYLLHAVPRAMRVYELRVRNLKWKSVMARFGATAGILYVELYALLLAWKPADLSPETIAALASYFAPLSWILRLFGIWTWLSV